MALFTGGDPDETALLNITRTVYGHAPDRFRHSAIAPLTQLAHGLWVQELFHGPTLAFKDFALQMLGPLFDRALAKADRRVTIVGATSGDTGSAAIAGCAGCDRVKIVILHPHERVSPVQRRQMTTVTAANVTNLAVRGTFDDCQAMVKALFADTKLRDDVGLAAVNSINWARIMAQVVYYAWSALALGAPDRVVRFAVPTGNFGNVFAGMVARHMGLPIAGFVVASNRNDILTRFFETGAMTTEGVVPTLSPSMDIQVSSNFERFLFDLTERDAAAVRGMMEGFRQSGVMTPSAALWAQAKALCGAVRLDDEATLTEMRRTHADTGMVLDPHSAIGVAAARQALREDIPTVVMATAHPAKFGAAVAKAVGSEPALPAPLAALLDKPERFTVVPNDVRAVRDVIRNVS